MEAFNIIDIEQLTGIKAHTLRIWEQRYNFLTPNRDDTNNRWYTNVDLKMILEIALLKDNDYRISKIVQYSPVQRAEMAQTIIARFSNVNEMLMGLLLEMAQGKQEGFEKLLASIILKLGSDEALTDVVYPLLKRTGILWHRPIVTVNQTDLVRAVVQEHLRYVIRTQQIKMEQPERSYLLYLPEGETEQLAIMFAQFLIQQEGNEVHLLSKPQLPEQLKENVLKYKPDCIMTVMNTFPGSFLTAQAYVDELSNTYPNLPILVTGKQIMGQGIIEPRNVNILNKLQDLVDFMADFQLEEIY
ncbi:MerR family transcriptional regulator [Persicobacter psychrovividus]|uniref:MerR family transcriptional regulator n=1 Tax=Persicobacter psychrovividus TaxID=387638 RepID=A0ABM7VJL0_9BACT|nr:MerR family transcriptional regulator [Persicobacter psychrovividus]